MDDMRDNFEEELGEDEALHGEDASLLDDEDAELDDEDADPLLDGFQIEGEEDEPEL